MNEVKIKKINQVLADFFEKNNKMDYDRRGLPIRNVLRELDDKNQLDLIPYVVVDRKDKNRNWFFEPLK